MGQILERGREEAGAKEGECGAETAKTGGQSQVVTSPQEVR